MQTTISNSAFDKDGNIIDKKKRTEFFVGKNDDALFDKMDNRLEELKAKGERLVERKKIGRNESCPCGSNKKFKKCCLLK